MILSIDIGSTFTDFVLLKNQAILTHKNFSTHAPEAAILKGIDDLGLTDIVKRGELSIIHNGNETITTFLKKYGADITLAQDYHPSTNRFLSELAKTPSQLIFNLSGSSAHSVLIENNIEMVEECLNIGGESMASLNEKQLIEINPFSENFKLRSACYGLGGDQPTVTDANLILGRLRPDIILGNAIRPDINAARMALAKLAGMLNIRIEDVALAIVNAANQKIIESLQIMLKINSNAAASLTLCAGGSSAGLHVCAVAEALNIKNVVVPLFSGVFSAFNMLTCTDPVMNLPNINYKKERASCVHIRLHGITLPVSVWQRCELSAKEMIMGPAIIVEDTSTVFLQNGWLAYVDPTGHLLVRRMAIDVY